MKKYTIFFLLLIAALTTCKKEPEAPTGGNKIEIGQTTTDSVGYFAAKVSTTLESTGGNQITQHGHCWSTKTKPSIDDNKTTLGKLSGPKTYTSELTGLKDNTSYYVRSYVTYPYGTIYGTEQKIKTLKTGLPLVNTSEVTDVTLHSAKCGGNVLSDSGLFVMAKGICWDTTNIFTLKDCLDSINAGNGTGNYTSNLTGLNEGKTYYVKAFAINKKGTSYGEVKQFSTIPITTPVVTTSDITEITINSAKSGGNVTSDGNGTITARGVCWNTANNPTLENSVGHTTDGTGTGSFTSSITVLNDGVEYFVRAYATNEKGTVYGATKEFTTIEITLPEVETKEVMDITLNSAKSGGNVTNNGNSIITSRGVCWNTSGNPNLENNLGNTTDGNGMGSFNSNITGLMENTTYYIVAYATNEKGTNYGNVKVFTTLIDACEGDTLITYHGKTYKIINIGNQCWMKENLNYETGTSWCYNNDSVNCEIYGRLYDWETIMNGSSSSNEVPSGVRGICPEGWHIPSDAEWDILINYLGGSDVAGGKMKEVGTGYWNSPNTGATNESGFTALPGGEHNLSGYFFSLGEYGYWWSATAYSSAEVWIRLLYYDEGKVGRDRYLSGPGFSVRCIKD